MYTISSAYKEFDKAKWTAFIENHPNGNIFHSPEMVEISNSTLNREPIVVACFDESNEFAGILIAEIQRLYRGLLGGIAARSIIMGGPLVKNEDNEIVLQLLNVYNNIVRKKVVYSQFRNIWDIKKYTDQFSEAGYTFEEHLDIIFNLKKGSDFLWEEIHPTRRKQIKRSIRRDIKTRIVNFLGPEELKACYSIMRSVYDEAKLPFPDIYYFQIALKILVPKGFFKAVLAIYDAEIIGFRFFLSFKGLLYDWYAGSKKAHYDKYPNDILPWEILQWGTINGYETFDFGGAGKPDEPYGVRDYKLKFGGTLVNFGRFDKIHRPLTYKIAKQGFNFWRKLKLR